MMPRRQLPGQRGFTIIEMLISLSIFFLVLAGMFSVFGPSNALHAAGQRKVDVQQSGRVAMDMIVRQIRMAGYYPENFDRPDVLANLVGPVTVQIATDTALAVYGDTDATGTSNVFLFCLNGGSLRIGKGANNVLGSYQCNGSVLADNITGLRFSYYDANNDPVPNPPAAPYQLDAQGLGTIPDFLNTAERAAIRTVVVTLTAQETVPGQQPQIYTLSSDVRLRNLD
jgi:type IV pilus assembly protein PilW